MNTTDFALRPPAFEASAAPPLLAFVPRADGRGLDPLFLPGLRLFGDALLRELAASAGGDGAADAARLRGAPGAVRDALGVIAAAAGGCCGEVEAGGGRLGGSERRAAAGLLNDAVARARDGSDDGALATALGVAHRLGGPVGGFAGAVLARAADDDVSVADALVRAAVDAGLIAAAGPAGPALAEALFGERLDGVTDAAGDLLGGAADAAGDLLGGIGDAVAAAADAVGDLVAGDNGDDGTDSAVGAGEGAGTAVADRADAGGERNGGAATAAG